MAKSKSTTKNVTKKSKNAKPVKVAKKVARKPAVAPRPRALTPYLAVNDATRAIDWYKTVFGAKVEGDVQPGPGGMVMHAALRIGDSQLFLSDIFPGSDLVDATRAGASVTMHYYRPNAGHVWERAVSNGAKVTMPFADQFWGDMYGKLLDPFGHSWSISCKSKLNKAQLEKLLVEAIKQMAPQ